MSTIEVGATTSVVQTFKGATRWYFHTIKDGKILNVDWESSEKARDRWIEEHRNDYPIIYVTRIDFPAINQADPCV